MFETEPTLDTAYDVYFIQPRGGSGSTRKTLGEFLYWIALQSATDNPPLVFRMERVGD